MSLYAPSLLLVYPTSYIYILLPQPHYYHLQPAQQQLPIIAIERDIDTILFTRTKSKLYIYIQPAHRIPAYEHARISLFPPTGPQPVFYHCGIRFRTVFPPFLSFFPLHTQSELLNSRPENAAPIMHLSLLLSLSFFPDHSQSPRSLPSLLFHFNSLHLTKKSLRSREAMKDDGRE